MLSPKNALLYASAAALIGSYASVGFADPTNNPIDAQYGSTYSWTDNIKWNNVFNITNYGGVGDGTTDNLAAINSAINAASAAGGGVVYLPSGTYNFSNSVQLKNGVVIRGADPTGVTNATQAGYAPPTQMVFPKYNFQGVTTAANTSTAFKTITSANPYTDSNIGVVNVDVNRAEIALGVDGSTLATNGGTPSLAARNTDIVVYGVRSNNVAIADPNPVINATNPGQVFDYRFTANVLVQPWRNALVANNRLNDIKAGDAGSDSFVEPNYKVGNTSTVLPGTFTVSPQAGQPNGMAMFDYDSHYGIVASRPSAGVNNIALNNIPSVDPYLYRPGVSVVDNYVYTSDRVKIQAAGFGTNIANNTLMDFNYTPFVGAGGATQKISWVNSTGVKLTDGTSTLEQRGIDITGWNVNVNNNNITVYRSLVGQTYNGTTHTFGYLTNDGEGILNQESASAIVNGMNITNNTINTSWIMIYKTKEIRNLTITGNTVRTAPDGNSQTGQIYVVSDTNGGAYPAYNVKIQNNSVDSGILFQAEQYTNGTDGNEISGNSGTGSLNAKATPNVFVHDNSLAVTAPSVTASQVDMGPSISITSPTFLQTINGSDANLTAATSDPSSTVTHVEFYDQVTDIGAGTLNQDGTWSFDYTGLTPGEYMVSSVATAADGKTYSSYPEYFTIAAAVPEPASLGLLIAGSLMALRRRHR